MRTKQNLYHLCCVIQACPRTRGRQSISPWPPVKSPHGQASGRTELSWIEEFTDKCVYKRALFNPTKDISTRGSRVIVLSNVIGYHDEGFLQVREHFCLIVAGDNDGNSLSSGTLPHGVPPWALEHNSSSDPQFSYGSKDERLGILKHVFRSVHPLPSATCTP